MKQMADVIRALREDRDLTQNQIAGVLHTTQQMYSRYENGQTEVPARHIVALAQFYSVTTDYIFGLRSEQTDEK